MIIISVTDWIDANGFVVYSVEDTDAIEEGGTDV